MEIRLYDFSPQGCELAPRLSPRPTRSVPIAFQSEAEDLQLRIENDGVGFEAENPEARGMGLRTMQYRARLIGGTLEIDSRPGEGTSVTFTLPRPSPSTKSAEETSPPPNGTLSESKNGADPQPND